MDHTKTLIPLPYNLTEAELTITDSMDHIDTAKGMDDVMPFLVDEVSWADEDQMERLMRSAVLIYHHLEGAAPFAHCLEQAIIWERG
jgi:hypothetical protein